jgi:hypothetical protein
VIAPDAPHVGAVEERLGVFRQVFYHRHGGFVPSQTQYIIYVGCTR